MGALLTLAMTAALIGAPAHVRAQTLPVNMPQTAATVTPANIASMAQQGLTSQATAALAQQTGMDAGLANTIISNIAQGGINQQAATDLIGGLVRNQISAAVGEALSKMPGLGNLDLGQIAGSALNSALQSALGGTGNQAQIIQQAGAALGIAGGPGAQNALAGLQQGATQAAVNAAANALSQAFPDLANVLGGPQGISNILGGLLGGGFNFNFGGSSDPSPGGASCNCESDIGQHHATIRSHMTNKRKEHEIWLVTEFFARHVAPALMLMAEQLTVTGMQQVQIIGSFFDAKHQLETQRLLQQLTAEAHKDYQPSEGLCTFGTSVRSLASSERAANLAQEVIAERNLSRQLRNSEGLSGAILEDGKPYLSQDRASRAVTFVERFCDRTDNNKTLDVYCKDTDAPPEMLNRDIDYTRSVENKLTLDLDFYSQGNENPSDDEASIFALGANLYGHDVIPYIDANTLLGFKAGRSMSGESQLMDARALNAKRSVAQNSFAAITGMRAAGTAEAQPYLYKMVAELGVPEDDLEKLLGKNPSYFAQMEILTKKALQNPVFYTELYDKPANVDRKGAVLQAVALMQDRDIYNSLLRSEAILSVLLDTMLQKEHDDIAGRIEVMNRRESGAASRGGPQP